MSAVNVNVGSLAEGLFDLIGDLWTSEEERNEARLKLIELEQKGMLAQVAVNQTEAAHESIFVAGWRPFIGWAGGAALAYNFVVQPLLVFLANAVGGAYGWTFPLDALPVLNLGDLMVVLMGMLGLGTLRTYEKVTGTNTNRVVADAARSVAQNLPRPAPRPAQQTTIQPNRKD